MMHHLGDLPETIPLFPLPGAVLLPRARLPLNVFEPRYLVMLEEALKTPGRLIGMIQPCPTVRDADHLYAIGCAGRVTQFVETDDGRYEIVLTGVSRFRLLGEVEGFTPYRRARISWEGFERDLGAAEADPGFDRDGFMELLRRYFDTQALQTDWPTLQGAEDEFLINALSMLLEFEPEDKQALLEAPCLGTRRETLIALIEYVLYGGTDKDLMQ